MKNILSKGQLSILIVLGLLILDQAVKIAVKTNMHYGEDIHIADWFQIHFIENNGMAFGMQIIPKAIQTISRMIFAAFLIWYVSILVKAKYKRGYIICISMVVAGAIGNIIDSVFYGVIFSKSTPFEVSTFVSIGSGYADWLYGKVVDMLYFPLFEFNWPSWMPFVGGENFIFFSPVFNIADAVISCGMLILILFYTQSLNSSIRLVKCTLKRLTGKSGALSH